MAASSALKAALGDSYALLEEAGVAEYVEETLQGVVDDGGGAEDIQEAVLPFLLDAGAVAGDEEGEALCAVLHAQLQLGSAPAPSPGDEFKKLDNAVSMGKLVKADEAQVVADNAEKLKVQINYNTTLGPSRPPVNSLIDEDESEEAMKRRFKAEKRAAKRLKRELRREKLQGMQREEFMRELTREPVVLHWKGGGGGPRDILLKDAQMEIAGKQLLKDTDLTIVYGRKYGLVGRNGVGKTTFLKFLAEARFEGVPPNLQILHIEQEVVGGEQTVLDMVLATDVERSALLAEEAELLGEAEEEEAEARAAVEAGGAGKDADDLADEAERQSRLLEIAQRLDEIDARSAPSRAGAILFGLGFDSEMQQQPTSSFSGGWRMRVSLARALFIEPGAPSRRFFADAPRPFPHSSPSVAVWAIARACVRASVRPRVRARVLAPPRFPTHASVHASVRPCMHPLTCARTAQTCCCSTSRPTTSTYTPCCGSRSTCRAGTSRSLW